MNLRNGFNGAAVVHSLYPKVQLSNLSKVRITWSVHGYLNNTNSHGSVTKTEYIKDFLRFGQKFSGFLQILF